MLRNKVEDLIKKSINSSIAAKALGELDTCPEEISVEFPKNPEHGDRAISIAMKLTKEAKISPRNIAQEILNRLDGKSFSKIDIAGPGFINLTLSWGLLEELIAEIHQADHDYGRCKHQDRPDKSYSNALIEFVSANPTGDLHLGHGRQAVLGSALAELLRWGGYKVNTEFYINDAGVQIDKLANSAKEAVLIQEERLDESAYDSENNYPLDSMLEFIKSDDVIAALIQINKDNPIEGISGREITLENIPASVYGDIAKKIFLVAQKEILQIVGTEFDKWYSEKENLHHKDSNGKTKVDIACESLLAKGLAYQLDGALWFKATEFGDERDRVLRKADSNYTYLAADIAYHQDKLARGNDKLINLWGADHHGQIPGIKGALTALGEDAGKLEVILIQMVSLRKGNLEVKMSKRDGNVVTVNELIQAVGVDAFRYFLIESQANNRIVFDLELATKQDKDNPIYYIQYAHARSCSILRNLRTQQFDQTSLSDSNKISEALISEDTLNTWLLGFKNNSGLFERKFSGLELESLASTRALILGLAKFPELIEDAACTKSPYKVAHYLKELATLFHQFYTHNRVINEDKELMQARINLVSATQKVLHNGLKILGISAPQKM